MVRTSRRAKASGTARLAVGVAVAVLGGAALGGWGPFVGYSVDQIDPIGRFLFAVAMVLLVSHAFGELLHRFGQPRVLGEIVGGLVLGPSALGLVWPASTQLLFPAEVRGALQQAGQIGLVVFMFLLGSELSIGRIGGKRLVAAVVAGGMGLPLVAGAGIALVAGGSLAGAEADGLGYPMFLGLALAITALPVLARILLDLGIDRTRVGAVAMSSAAIGDGIAWLTLSVILAGVGASGDAMTTAVLGVALVVVAMLCVRPLLARLVRSTLLGPVLPVVLVAGAFMFAAATQFIHLHPVIGAFLFGLAVPRDCAVVERANQQLQGFTLAILLPLFFAGAGLGTSVALIGSSAAHWLLFLAILVVAQVTKVAGAGGSALLAGAAPRDALRIGVLMNCRGVTEIVVAAIGLEYGLINELGFTILVLTAIITTASTGPLMRWLDTRPSAVAPPVSAKTVRSVKV